jgi:hypothetical protein
MTGSTNLVLENIGFLLNFGVESFSFLLQNLAFIDNLISGPVSIHAPVPGLIHAYQPLELGRLYRQVIFHHSKVAMKFMFITKMVVNIHM